MIEPENRAPAQGRRLTSEIFLDSSDFEPGLQVRKTIQ